MKQVQYKCNRRCNNVGLLLSNYSVHNTYKITGLIGFIILADGVATHE